MLLWSYALGIVNVLTLGLAFAGRKLIAAIVSILAQGPWTYYDLRTHQPGFLFISAGSLTVCAMTIWKCRCKATSTQHGPEAQD